MSHIIIIYAIKYSKCLLAILRKKILDKIKKSDRGTLFINSDFIDFANSKAVSKALERLVIKGEISRIAREFYAINKVSKLIGEVRPTTEYIALKISERDKTRIMPTGTSALNALGLSTQVPTNVVYLTDGSPRKIAMNRRKILFKRTSTKNLSTIGPINGLVIIALKSISKGLVTDNEIEIILKHLKNEKPENLIHDIKLAPEWIRVIMRKALP